MTTIIKTHRVSRSFRASRVCCAATLVALAFPALALAQSGAVWHGQTPPGLVTPINYRVEVESVLGSSQGADMESRPFTATSTVRLQPAAPPFTTIRFVDLSIQFGPGCYNLEFYCSPMSGCMPMTVEIEFTTMALSTPTTVTLDASGAFALAATFDVQTVGTMGGTQTGSFDSWGTIPITLTGRFDHADSTATLDSLFASEFPFPAPASTLPIGVTAVTFTRFLFNKGNRLVGPLMVADPADINADGQVNGLDLGILVAGWGSAGAADINNDGVVNGADMGLLLSAWD
ncbi:MAG: hypothetical protein EXS00_08510 [Phycisphaerales bacterium]|nr:hypothetical protein [Phycisphaerales bacterium]